jgi:hypothetical protein
MRVDTNRTVTITIVLDESEFVALYRSLNDGITSQTFGPLQSASVKKLFSELFRVKDEMSIDTAVIR